MNVLKNIDSIRKDFPILNTSINGNKLIYLDNAATSQTPNCVINSISDYYKNLNSNIHRGVHSLSQMATEKYEDTRKKFKSHFNAKSSSEIIFTSGTTHSINLVSSGFSKFLNIENKVEQKPSISARNDGANEGKSLTNLLDNSLLVKNEGNDFLGILKSARERSKKSLPSSMSYRTFGSGRMRNK